MHPFLKSLILTLAVLPAACGVRPRQPMQGEHAAATVITPFAPASIQIHPLTRVDVDSKGRVWIICHLEMRDAWGDTCKGTGKLEVQLYRPAGGRAGGIGIQDLSWAIDLSDLDRNASLYDPATRTYRLQLQDPPSWVADSLDPKSQSTPSVRLRAVLATHGPKGEDKLLQNEYTIGG